MANRRRPKGIELGSMRGVKLPGPGEPFKFYEGIFNDAVDLVVLRIVLPSGLTLTRARWFNGNDVTWKLWHYADVFFAEPHPVRPWLSTVPKGNFSYFPTKELEEWFTRPELGVGMNIFEASFAVKQIEDIMVDLCAQQDDWVKAEGWRTEVRLRKKLRASMRNVTGLTPVSISA